MSLVIFRQKANIDINGIRFTVMKMDKHRVADIDIRLPDAETEQSPSEH